MHRNNLLTLLDQYRPETPGQIGYKSHIQQFVTQYPDCFERSLLIGHITASAWLINHDNTKALLMHHAKLNKWLQLGGHCDGNPDVLAVAITESQEESGLTGIEPVMQTVFDLDIHTIPVHKAVSAHIHYDIRFLLRAPKDEPLRINSESKGLHWVGPDIHQLPTDEYSVIRMFEKWRSYSMAQPLHSSSSMIYLNDRF